MSLYELDLVLCCCPSSLFACLCAHLRPWVDSARGFRLGRRSALCFKRTDPWNFDAYEENYCDILMLLHTRRVGVISHCVYVAMNNKMQALAAIQTCQQLNPGPPPLVSLSVEFCFRWRVRQRTSQEPAHKKLQPRTVECADGTSVGRKRTLPPLSRLPAAAASVDAKPASSFPATWCARSLTPRAGACLCACVCV